jgi:hypothetical protein
MKRTKSLLYERRYRSSLFSLVAIGMFALCAACASPEAQRTRGGGPGADLGNRDASVELHAGAQPYYQTPCRRVMQQC